MKVFALLLIASALYADSVTATSQWVVWPTGNSANAGCFDPTISGGVDASQSATPLVTFNGTTVTATTAGVGATITISGYTVLTTNVGNCLLISAGTNFIAGYYTIVSVNTGSNTWTLNANVTTGAGSAMAGRAGGASDHPQTVLSHMAAGNVLYVKVGTYTITAGMTMNAGATGKVIAMIGYTTTFTDGGKPTIQISSGSGLVMITTASLTVLRNFILDGNGSSSQGCNCQNGMIDNIEIKNLATYGIVIGNNVVRNIYVHNLTGDYGVIFLGSGECFNCTVINGTNSGGFLFNQAGSACFYCIAANNTGAVDGFTINPYFGNRMNHCVAARNGRYGVNLAAAGSGDYGSILNTIFSRNTTADLISNTNYTTNTAAASAPLINLADYNAFDSTGTARTNMPVGAHDITLTGDPFVNAVGGDFTLTSTAKTALVGFGYPGTLINGVTTSSPTIGVYQPATSGSSGTRVYSIH